MSDLTVQAAAAAPAPAARTISSPRRTGVELERVTRNKPASVLADSLVLARRSLMRIPRQPDWLVGVTLFPIMFLLLFRYIFGGTVQATMPAGENAVNYLVVGVVIQGLGFGGLNTSLGLAMDAKEGLMDRFRALPMTRSSVLLGRILADMAIATFTTTITFIAGFLVGFRPEASFIEWVYAFGLMLLLAFSLAWIGAVIGMALKTVEAVNSIGFAVMFPLTFLSSAFTRVEFLPSWMQGFARNQPFTLVIDSVRGWLTGYPDVGNKGIYATGWLLLGLAIAVPLATWMYERRSQR
ncbi:MAG TPA: ABC transporter permease [Thermomicrobiales bacterium]|nr:ABC transporter permease [Thermomicrobiales bacterium]